MLTNWPLSLSFSLSFSLFLSLQIHTYTGTPTKSLSPEALVRNRSMPHKLQYKQALISKLQEKENEQKQIMTQVREKRIEINRLFQDLYSQENSDFIHKGIYVYMYVCV